MEGGKSADTAGCDDFDSGAVILLGSRVLTPDTRRSLSAWIGGGMSGITAAAVGILLLAVIVTVSYLTSVKIFLKKRIFNQGESRNEPGTREKTGHIAGREAVISDGPAGYCCADY